MRLLAVLFFMVFIGNNLNAGVNISFKPNIINFGAVESSAPSKTIKVTMKNNDNYLYSIANHQFIPNVNGFITTDLPDKFTMKPFAEMTFNVKLSPSKAKIGQFQIKLTFTIRDTSDRITLSINGNIFKPQQTDFSIHLAIPNIEVEIGENFNLPVIIKSINLKNTKIDNVSCAIKYNASVLALVNGGGDDIIEYGTRTSYKKITVKRTLKTGDTLLSFPMTAALGNATASDIILNNIIFYSKGSVIQTALTRTNGHIKIKGIIYQDKIPRLVSNLSSDYYIYPPPNPVNKDFTLRVIYSGKAQLKIYSIEGFLVKDLSSLLPVKSQRGSEKIVIPRNIFSNLGAYIIGLSGINAFVNKMIIVK